MIISQGNNRTTYNSAQAKETEFTVNNSALMFEMLSSGLYKNPEAAVVRELCCNAYDSHVAAGCKDTPIAIHFPTEQEPHFSVEDFGTGLDEAGVRNAICGIFNSTKGNTNDQIGGLGLGSKTPFSVASTFSIQSRFDGSEKTYVAYIGDEGKPFVTLMTDISTSSSNGVKITVPLGNGDLFWKFRAEARYILSFLGAPVSMNVPIGELKEDFRSKVESAGVLVYDYELGRGNVDGYALYSACMAQSALTVMMGGVAYHVGRCEDVLKPEINDAVKVLTGEQAIFINVAVGDVHINPSRESIRMDDHNVKLINDRMGTWVNEKLAAVKKMADDGVSLVDIIINSLTEMKFKNTTDTRNFAKLIESETGLTFPAAYPIKAFSSFCERWRFFYNGFRVVPTFYKESTVCSSKNRGHSSFTQVNNEFNAFEFFMSSIDHHTVNEHGVEKGATVPMILLFEGDEKSKGRGPIFDRLQSNEGERLMKLTNREGTEHFAAMAFCTATPVDETAIDELRQAGFEIHRFSMDEEYADIIAQRKAEKAKKTVEKVEEEEEDKRPDRVFATYYEVSPYMYTSMHSDAIEVARMHTALRFCERIWDVDEVNSRSIMTYGSSNFALDEICDENSEWVYVRVSRGNGDGTVTVNGDGKIISRSDMRLYALFIGALTYKRVSIIVETKSQKGAFDCVPWFEDRLHWLIENVEFLPSRLTSLCGGHTFYEWTLITDVLEGITKNSRGVVPKTVKKLKYAFMTIMHGASDSFAVKALEMEERISIYAKANKLKAKKTVLSKRDKKLKKRLDEIYATINGNYYNKDIRLLKRERTEEYDAVRFYAFHHYRKEWNKLHRLVGLGHLQNKYISMKG